MPLTSLFFIIPTTYGMFAMISYVVVAYFIIKNWKTFKGSFFTLYLASTVINIWTFFNQFATIRLPNNTCKNCLLNSIFEQTHWWGLDFCYFMQVQFAYIQFLMIMITSLNRCSMIYLPYIYENIWSRLTIPLVIFVCIAPTAFNYPVLVEGAYYGYVNSSDRYMTTARAKGYLLPFIVPFMVIVTIINVLLNVAALVKLVLHRTVGTKKSETNLLIMSALNFVIQAIAAVITLFNFTSTAADLETKLAYRLAADLLPYISDCLTLLSPFLLYSCSSSLRQLMFGNSKMFRVSPNSNTRTSMV